MTRALSDALARPLLQNSFCKCDDRTVLMMTYLAVSHVSALLAVPVMFSLSLKVRVCVRAGRRAKGQQEQISAHIHPNGSRTMNK